MILRNPILIFRPCCAWLVFILLCSVSAARAQGPAPETAPPLFPGGGLISYKLDFHYSRFNAADAEWHTRHCASYVLP